MQYFCWYLGNISFSNDRRLHYLLHSHTVDRDPRGPSQKRGGNLSIDLYIEGRPYLVPKVTTRLDDAPPFNIGHPRSDLSLSTLWEYAIQQWLGGSLVHKIIALDLFNHVPVTVRET